MKSVLVAGAAAVAVLGVAAPANAGTDYHTCTPDFWGTCASGYVPANSSGHYVTVAFDTPGYNANTPSSWTVRDVNTGVVVASGKAWSWNTPSTQTIYGLYGTYQLTISGAWGNWGSINNYDL